MIIIRNVNGAIAIGGKKINMYVLSHWLQNTYRIAARKPVRPSQVTAAILKRFIEQEPKAFR